MGIAVRFGARRFRKHVDRAADRILPVKRSLWATQHLDPADVDEAHQRAHGAGDIDAVEIEADAGFGPGDEVFLTYPANEHVAGRVPNILRRSESQVGDEVLQPAQIRKRTRLDLSGIQGHHRNRCALKFLFAPPRGNDNRL
jgi:hypothetical protein